MQEQEEMAGELTWPAIVVSYGPTTMRSGAMLMPYGCTLTAVADAEITVGEIVMPCAGESDSVLL